MPSANVRFAARAAAVRAVDVNDGPDGEHSTSGGTAARVDPGPAGPTVRKAVRTRKAKEAAGARDLLFDPLMHLRANWLGYKQRHGSNPRRLRATCSAHRIRPSALELRTATWARAIDEQAARTPGRQHTLTSKHYWTRNPSAVGHPSIRKHCSSSGALQVHDTDRQLLFHL